MDQYTREYGRQLDRIWGIQRKNFLWMLTHTGRPPYSLDRASRDEILDRAWYSAYHALMPLAEREFKSLTLHWTTKRPLPKLGRRGPLDWNEVKQFIGDLPNLGSENHVYVFWDDDTCIYVGKSSVGHKGGGGKWDSSYWRLSNKFRVFSTEQYRDLAKFECLAMDYFDPLENDIKAEDRRYHSKCPVHERLNEIEEEMKKSYKLR